MASQVNLNSSLDTRILEAARMTNAKERDTALLNIINEIEQIGNRSTLSNLPPNILDFHECAKALERVRVSFNRMDTLKEGILSTKNDDDFSMPIANARKTNNESSRTTAVAIISHAVTRLDDVEQLCEVAKTLTKPEERRNALMHVSVAYARCKDVPKAVNIAKGFHKVFLTLTVIEKIFQFCETPNDFDKLSELVETLSSESHKNLWLCRINGVPI